MARLEKQYPPFECIEYDYGSLAHREYEGEIYATLKFTDGVDLHVYFEFKDFLDHHKRKKSPFYRSMEHVLNKMSGWGSRYFELIEELQADDSLDMFQLFADFIEILEDELLDRYEHQRYNIAEAKRDAMALKYAQRDIQSPVEPKKEKEKKPEPEPEEDDDETEEESPYDKDRKKFEKLLFKGSNEMYDALKVNFFPEMAYFQRRYPSKWKSFTENLEEILQSFEDHMLDAMLPELDEDEYMEFDLKYNSEKADMSDDDEPPTAR